jgi:hypothetical protein
MPGVAKAKLHNQTAAERLAQQEQQAVDGRSLDQRAGQHPPLSVAIEA